MKVEIVLSTVLVISTVAYTYISLKLWRESKATREQKIAPFIVAFLKSTESHNVLALYIKNIGEGLAKNVKINVVKDYYQLGQKDLPLSKVGIVKNGFNNFPPQYELCFYIDFMPDLSPEDNPGTIEIEISYESTDKRKFENSYSLLFNQITGQNHSNPPESFIGQIPYYLKEINKNLETMRKNDEKRTALLQNDSGGN